jgi:hypothetical protein
MRTPEQIAEDYRRFRGKCKELAEAAVVVDPTLTLTRGHYFCPIWSRNEPHWWTVRVDGSIHDPTVAQFPSNGAGIYTPFDGIVECAECGKEMSEEEAMFHGNYVFCSNLCACRFVGIA